MGIINRKLAGVIQILVGQTLLTFMPAIAICRHMQNPCERGLAPGNVSEVGCTCMWAPTYPWRPASTGCRQCCQNGNSLVFAVNVLIHIGIPTLYWHIEVTKPLRLCFCLQASSTAPN